MVQQTLYDLGADETVRPGNQKSCFAMIVQHWDFEVLRQ